LTIQASKEGSGGITCRSRNAVIQMWAEALWAHPGTMREGIDGSMYVIWV